MNLDTYIKDLIDCKGTWQETTLSDDLKEVRDDMFICTFKGVHGLGIRSNADIIANVYLIDSEKDAMIKHYGLVPKTSMVFNRMVTYRTLNSQKAMEVHDRIMCRLVT